MEVVADFLKYLEVPFIGDLSGTLYVSCDIKQHELIMIDFEEGEYRVGLYETSNEHGPYLRHIQHLDTAYNAVGYVLGLLGGDEEKMIRGLEYVRDHS